MPGLPEFSFTFVHSTGESEGTSVNDERLRRSSEEYRRALRTVVEGTTQSRTPETLIPGVYPTFGKRGQGAHIWDVDGNRYVDWILCFGTILLGHSHPVVNAAAIREIEEGFALPLTRPVQTELAEKLVELIPCAEQVLFMKAGSEATSAAVRLSRLATGRDKIVRLGYHGWHDWSCTREAGIPTAVRELTLTFNYNDLDSLRSVLEDHQDQVACVIMWPCEVDIPDPGFLQGVKEIAHEHGALFVLDEIRTGFRLALGGAQQYFGVVPDLATFGKALANGFTLSMVAGRADYMRNVTQSWFSSTFNTSSIDQAAALATIGELQRTDAISHIWQIGSRLMEGLDALAQAHGVQAKTVSLPPTPYLKFTYPDLDLREFAKEIFFSETVRRGIFFHPHHHWFVSAAHGEEELSQTLEASEHAFVAVRRALDAGRVRSAGARPTTLEGGIS